MRAKLKEARQKAGMTQQEMDTLPKALFEVIQSGKEVA